MSYRRYQYERYREQPPRSSMRRTLITLTTIVWVLLIGLLLVRFVARPMLTRFGIDRLAQQLASRTGLPIGGGDQGALQGGSFTINESDANQWVATHRDELQGLDDVRLRFLPGSAEADLSVGGITSTARAGVQVVDGKVVLTNVSLDPPLGLFVDVGPYARLIQDRLNSDLASVGSTVTGVTIEQGRLVISVQ
jgi:hypothetical protein